MREDDEIGHYVPLLRRIIILVAVITAVPVVLWTITAFVRSYVGPPKIPTFHQLASTASINAPASDNSGQDATDRMMADAAKQAKLADPSSATIEARATAADVRNDAPAPKGPFLGDHPSENTANTPASAALNTPAGAPAPKLADTSTAVPIEPTPAAMAPPQATAAPDGTTPSVALAAQEPASEASPDAVPAAPPLSGPIPLPRHRPHTVTDTQTAQSAPMTQMASASPSGVPMPRPRPDAAGPGTSADTASGGPLDFLQNLFGGK
jgi:hypothetical protein